MLLGTTVGCYAIRACTARLKDCRILGEAALVISAKDTHSYSAHIADGLHNSNGNQPNVWPVSAALHLFEHTNVPHYLRADTSPSLVPEVNNILLPIRDLYAVLSLKLLRLEARKYYVVPGSENIEPGE